MVTQDLQYAEPIPGYRLTERIGSGGYGVVWKAEAPGGLTKAIKFVYGQFDDTRAAREMKALNRIKEVRHPFLLSLERIEVIEGQLLVVTELADMCLMDRFKQCTDSGLPGIPHDELIAYLRDAADALDYMSENFSLQHLDVKPENLLLVGGRIKVADFGLIKDLHEQSASVMGGFTPIYAPPEAFDGRASRHSDQYSLAIVYQEMLTGVLPFPGKTAAQLTAQHLNSRPMLSPVPVHDRPILERALAKDSEKRFGSCHALIERLAHAPAETADSDSTRKSDAPAGSSGSAADALQDSAVDTDPHDWRATQPTPKRQSADARATQQRVPGRPPAPPRESGFQTDRLKTQVAAGGNRPSTLPPKRRAVLDPLPPLVDLPPVDLSGARATLRPTLFLGAGGTAASILRHLRRRLHDRFGTLASVPAMRMLLLDTDLKALNRATHSNDASHLEMRETLALPLRRPQDYRGDAKRFLQWLSRRWLYNIPRSLETEGLRPLGRLAFADHAAEVFERLREELAALVDPAVSSDSSETTGLPVREGAPRVYVIASISGGTGGGMVLDLAQAVRQTLHSLGQSSEDVSLLLLHSNGSMQGAKVIADANAYACLTELAHYQHDGGKYPGDPTSGLKPAAGDAALFPESYLVHLGEDLSGAEFDAATDSLAEYLFRDTATACGEFFERCRRETNPASKSQPAEVPLRTFGIWHTGLYERRILREETGALCQRLLDQWSKGIDEGRQTLLQNDSRAPYANGESVRAASSDDAEFKQRAEDQAKRLGLEVGPLTEQMRSAASEALPNDDQAAPAWDDPSLAAAEGAWDLHTEQTTSAMAEALRDWITELVDSPHTRIGGALRAANGMLAHLKSLSAEVTRRREDAEAEIELQNRSLRDSGSSSRAASSFLKRTVSSQISRHGNPETDCPREQDSQQVAVLNRVGDLVRSITGKVLSLRDQLQAMQQEVEEIAQGFPRPPEADQRTTGKGQEHAEELSEAIGRTIRRRLPALLRNLEERFQAEFLEKHGGLTATITSAADPRRTWPAALRSAAREVIRDALKDLDAAGVLLELPGEQADLQNLLGRNLEAVSTGWMPCSRTRRLLLVLPEGPSSERLREVVTGDLATQPSTLTGSTGEVLLCYEAEGLSLRHVAERLSQGRGDLLAIARRVHTRSDVDWSPLDPEG